MSALRAAAAATCRCSPRRAATSQVSFEFFPPKTEKMEETLWESSRRWRRSQPRFVSVTYGAGGSTRERTHATVARIARETALAAGRASDLRRGEPRARSTRSPAPIGSGRPPHRRAARRSARAGHQIRAASRRLSQRRRAGRGAEGGRAVRNFGRRLSRNPPEFGDRARPISTISSARSTPAPTARSPSSSSRPKLLPLPRRGRGGRHRRRDRAGHPAGLQRRPDPQVRGECGATIPPWMDRSVRRARRSSRPRASWSPPPSPPSCAASSMPAASAISISTR